MGKNKGICAICGKGGKLSFEHVPPQAAGNEPDATVYGLDEWLSRDIETGQMMGGYPQPLGTGVISLCKKCNEDTGAWYVPDFAKFVRAGALLHHELRHLDSSDPDESLDTKVVEFGVKQMRALAVMKQIVTTLLALNPASFGQKNPDLVRFVLDRESRGLPAKYRFYLTLFRGPLARFAGLGVQVDTKTHRPVFLTELAYPPFAYLMTIDSEPLQPMGEITEWVNRSIDEARDERLRLLLGFGHTAFPADYRSKAKVAADRAANEASTAQ